MLQPKTSIDIIDTERDTPLHPWDPEQTYHPSFVQLYMYRDMHMLFNVYVICAPM